MPESSAARTADAEQIVTLRVGGAHGIETGMLFGVTYGAVHIGDLVVTRVFRDESLARFVPDATEACAIEPPPGALEETEPDPRLWTIEASFFANNYLSSWQFWGFRIDESGAGVRWVDSPEKTQRIRLPKEVVARFRSVCEEIHFDQLRNEYSYDVADGKPFPLRAFGAPSLTLRVTHGEREGRVRVHAPWSIAEEPIHPDQEHAVRVLRLWETIADAVHPPPIKSWSSTMHAVVERAEEVDHEVILSAGRYDGVERGMRFRVSRENTFVAEVEVVRVEMHRCAARVVIVRPGRRIQTGDTAVMPW